MTQPHRSSGRRTGRLLAAAVITLGLVAGACSKKDGTTATTSKPSETAAPGATDAPADTAAPGDTTAPADTTAPSDTTAPTDTAAPVDTTPAKKPVYGGTLIVSGEAEVANAWTPAAMQCDSYCQQRARTFYDPLMITNTDLKTVGYLVDTFSANADFTVWTFKLRPGITFTDGTPMDADAAVYNLKVAGSGLLISAAVKDYGNKNFGKKDATGAALPLDLAIDVVDPLTFTITTGFNGDMSKPLPWPNLPATLTGQLGLMASPTWLKAVAAGTADAAAPIGTGPFTVESYAPADKLVVKRNPDYWQKDADGNQLPYLDGMEFRVIEDSETASQALQSGDIDMFSTSAAAVISEFRGMADQFPMTEQSSLTETNYILIDLDKPGPLQDARVRCALSKAVDRTELNDLTADGILQIANGLFSPGQEGYLEDNGFNTDQDIEGAKALLADYQAENPGDITVTYGTTVSNINAQVAELLQGYWSQIGVTTNIIQVPQDQFITKALFGDPEFFMFGWRNHAGVTIDNQYFWWHSSAAAPDGGLALNFGRLRDPIVDKGLETARSATDEAARKTAAEEVNREMAKECDQIPFSWTLWGTPHAPKVQGLGGFLLPDGSEARDGAGFSGQFWTQGLWIDPDLA